MHLVVARILDFDRQKGAGTDMQGQRRPADAALGERVEQRGCEVETGGGRGDGALGAGKDRLVIPPVARVAAARPLDIGRQRHRAVMGQRLAQQPGFEVELQDHVAFGMFLGDHGGKSLGEDDTVAGSQPARSLCKGAPHTAAEIAVECHLDRCRPATPDEPRRDHLGVVEDEQVARPQQ